MREAVTERLEAYRRSLAKFPVRQSIIDVIGQGGAGTLGEAQNLYLHVYAPVLVAYVEWVLQNAVQTGKRRLYFLARDAYPMYLAARRICQKRGYQIECRYLRVSRYAIRLPEYHLLRENCVERICVGGIRITFEKVMKRAGLTPEEIAEIAVLCGYAPDHILTRREILNLKEILKNTPQFLLYIYSHSRDAVENTVGYLEQEGMTEEIPYALVDSGWTGTLQQSIQNLLRTVQKERFLEGYYFGLYEIPHGEKRWQYHGFYFEPWGGIRRKVYFSNCLFETIFSHAEGMTLGYRKENGRFVPIRSAGQNPNAGTLSRNEEVLAAYLNAYLRLSACEKTGANAAEVCERLLAKAMGKPEKWEVEAYGGSLFCDDVLEGTMQSVAAALDREEIQRQGLLYRIPVMLGLRKGTVKDSAWMEGSIVREEGSGAAALRSVAAYKRMLYVRKALREIAKQR